jgi:hypothetical protein
MTKSASILAALALFGAPRWPHHPHPAHGPTSPSTLPELHWRFVGPWRAGWATVTAGVPSEPNTYYFGRSAPHSSRVGHWCCRAATP